MRAFPCVAAVSAAALVTPSVADACSAPVCWPGSFVPAPGAEVPANVPGFYWRPVRDNSGVTSPDPSQVTLTAGTAPDTALPMTATVLADGGYLLVPQQPLQPQTTYLLEDQTSCNGTTGPSTSFSVTAAAPQPIYLGELHAGEATLAALDVATPSGSCSAQVTAYQLPIDLAVTFESIAWIDVLLFETIVDGEVWGPAATINTSVPPGESWQGRAVDVLYRTCQSDDPYAQEGLAAGPHEVSFRAHVPGSSVIATSDSITVELWCPGEDTIDGDGDPNSGGGCSTTDSHTLSWSALALLGLVWSRRRRPR